MLLRSALLGLLSLTSALAEVSTKCRPRIWQAFEIHDTCAPWGQLLPQGGHSSWTHLPYCISPDGNVSVTTNNVFCVYTDARFAGGRGLSVITTPASGQKLWQLPVFHERSTSDAVESQNRTYTVKAEQGRGLGLFAERRVKQGEDILLDRPLLLVAYSIYQALGPVDRRLLQWRAVMQLPERGRRSLRDLAKMGREDEIDDVIQTNSFAMMLPDGAQYSGVMSTGSRINHDCRPNSYYQFDSETLTHRVWALRNIRKDEEVTHTYMNDPDALCVVRKQILQSTWGFECKCSVCGASPKNIQESDARLAEIATARTNLQNAIRDQQRTMTRHAEELMRLYDKEGLVIPKMEIFEIGAYAHGQVGHARKAMKWAKRARQWYIWARGPKSADAQRLSAFIEDPRRHPGWRTLAR